MSSNIEQAVVEKLRALPPEQQQQVLEFVEQLGKQSAAGKLTEVDPNSLPIWEVIRRISSEIPPEEWDAVPSDGSINLDHYLYGAPKKHA